MTREEIFNQVAETMAIQFELDQSTIHLETRLFEELDLDSIDAIDLVVKLQELTGQRIDEERLRGLRTVEDVVLLVEELLPGGAAAST